MIRVAQIVSVLGRAENGIFGAHKVILGFNESNYELPAYAKKLPDLDFYVEIIAALIGREIGLPIPEPVIAIDQDRVNVFFASLDVKYPDLTRSLTIQNNAVLNTPSNDLLLKKISLWPEINKAIGFDEWIANGDRNVGNILYDGKDAFFLIDHNQAMRLPFSPSAPIKNVLMDIHLRFTNDEVGRQRIKNKISKIIADINPKLPENIVDRLLAEYEQLDSIILMNMVEFLSQRLQYLAEITHQKIITSQLSL